MPWMFCVRQGLEQDVSRLVHRQGWQDAVWPSVTVAKDGEKGPAGKYITLVILSD